MVDLSRPAFAVIVSASLVLSGTGCSRDVRVGVHPVKGQLFFDGKPAVGAMVVFHPEKAADVRAIPRGRVDQDGRFQLSTYLANDGAPDGKYKVAIDWRKRNPDDPTDDEGISRVPAKYTKPATTPIEIAITPETVELPRIDVK